MPPKAYEYLRDVLDTLFEQDNLSEAMRGKVRRACWRDGTHAIQCLDPDDILPCLTLALLF